MTWRRRFLTGAALLAGALICAGIFGVLLVRSHWFFNQVRERLVSEVERASGGRVEIAAFDFDWTRMRAEVHGFTLHGREAADKPPLLRLEWAAVGVKVISIFKRDIDIRSLQVHAPRVFLTVGPDGSTNIPEPKLSRGSGNAMDSIFKLAVGRIDIDQGEIEIEKQGRTPLEVHAQQLTVGLAYDRAKRRYRGDVSIKPLELQLGKGGATPLAVQASVWCERNRIGVDRAVVQTGKTRVEASGQVEDLAQPNATFQYDAKLDIADGARLLAIRGLSGGAHVHGTARWQRPRGFWLDGALQATGVEFRSGATRLAGFRLDGTVAADEDSIRIRRAGIAGSVIGVFPRSALDLSGTFGEAELRGEVLDIRGMAMSLLDGTFGGDARLVNFDRFQVQGEIASIRARRAVALESAEAVPWDAMVSGAVTGQGSLEHGGGLKATGDLQVEPAAGSAPVEGHITAAYDTSGGILDLGHSTLRLPSSRVEFNGTLGRELRVRAQTGDFGDIMPVLGENAAAFPLKLDNGTARFDGTVTGTMENLLVQGHAQATRLVYQGQRVDRVQADVAASPGNVKARNATAAMGAMRAQGEMAVSLTNWQAKPGNLIYGKGTLSGGSITQIAELAGETKVPVSGQVDVSGEITGSIGNLIAAGTAEIRKAMVRGEPIDHATVQARYSDTRLEVLSAQMAAGDNQANLSGTFDHASGRWDAGKLVFRVTTNSLALDRIHSVVEERPGIRGTVGLAANGTVDLGAAKNGDMSWRIRDLHLDVNGQNLQVSDQPFGDVHVTANSEGDVLRAHLDSGIAGSRIAGNGEWKLTGEYPGSASVSFSKLDFADLREWISPAKPGDLAAFTGSAEGQLRIDGPALEPKLVKVELRIPNLTVMPPPGTAPAASAGALALHNSGPVVVSMVDGVVSFDSMRLVGHDTDITVSGKAQLRQRDALNLRVNGRVDLALLRDLNPDFRAAGSISTDASVRGPLDSPEVTGRTEFQNASFSVADVPNGISKANGVVTFSGSRATIQHFSGETGGGTIDVSGFASYGSGLLSFQVAARAREVRVRYPEGLSTVVNANLNLTGTSNRSMLSGSITVRRTGFNPQSDFSSIIAQSAEPVETPAARTGILGGLNFDIQVNTATDLQLQSTLAQDLQADANLQLKGTYTNPAVLGRINITRGQIVFFGTRYKVTQGSVAFYNPLRVEPIIDVALETKARGVAVTLTVSGPLHHLNLTPSSDPPLSFNEIVALLATGRTPTSDPALLAQQTSTPQSWQQMGASALLGQAIASPVAGRLQRFFGVTNLRIDPTITGVENNAQARVTVEQQVTPDITFTYITNVTTSNPQVVRVEWSFSRHWSAVAVRDENGMFGMDFLYKKRFK